MPEQTSVLIGILDRILAATDKDRICIGDLVQAIGSASFTPVLLIPALAVVSPLSGIPLFSAVMGMLIFLVSSKMLLRRGQLWLPGWILRRRIDSARVRSAFTRLRPVMAWLDAHTHARLTAFVHRPLVFVPQALCVLSGLTMPFLEFIPFSSSLVGGAVALLAFGMLARDGLFVVLGSSLYLVPVWLFFHIT
jgi:hypothetical protein